MQLMDPDTGKTLWAQEDLHACAFTLAPGEEHVMVNVGSEIMRVDPNGSAPRMKDGRAPYGRFGCYRLSPEGAERKWAFPDEPHFLIPTWNDSLALPRAVIRNGLVYATTEGPDRESDRRFIIAELKTGRVLVDAPREGGFWFRLIGDKLLHALDWSHGHRASFDLYAADPANFSKLGTTWKPMQPLTTAYQVAMEPPVVDGHLFLRTEQGTVVCYDLGP